MALSMRLASPTVVRSAEREDDVHRRLRMRRAAESAPADARERINLALRSGFFREGGRRLAALALRLLIRGDCRLWLVLIGLRLFRLFVALQLTFRHYFLPLSGRHVRRVINCNSFLRR